LDTARARSPDNEVVPQRVITNAQEIVGEIEGIDGEHPVEATARRGLY